MRRARLILPLVLLAATSVSALGASAPKPPPPPPSYPSAGSSTGFGWNGTTICGGNTFSTCAAVNVSAIWDANGNVTVTMRVTNMSGSNGTFAGTVFTQVGLWNVPTGGQGQNTWPTYGGSYTVVDQNNQDVSAAWQPGSNGLSGAGIQPGVFGVDPTKGINGGLAPGNTYTFTFTLSGWQGSAPDFNSLGFAAHGQGGPNGCSTKLVVDAGGTANQPNPNDPTVQACGTTVTPEPVTMSLLATGLAGMGGAGMVRRRRKQADA